MKKIILLFILLYSLTAYTQTKIGFYTSMGDFRVELREDLMPISAGNYITLIQRKFYDGLIFHRVVAGFVIQGGDPTGNGNGGPGYTISDEYHTNMNHDSAGVIAMAKTSAPNSAGSQFYFSLDKLASLDGRYAVFGSCYEGLQVILAIGRVAVTANDKPLVDVVMDSIRILETPTSIHEPKGFIKAEAYPNPFVKTIRINYELKTAGDVTLEIYDMHGRLIQTLVDEKRPTGISSTSWNRTNLRQNKVPAGIYHLVIRNPSGTATLKLIVND